MVYSQALFVKLFNVVKWMSRNTFDVNSTLVQVMCWCHQATSHYLCQCWSRTMTPIGVTRPQGMNTHLPVMHDWCKCITSLSNFIQIYHISCHLGILHRATIHIIIMRNLTKVYHMSSLELYPDHDVIKWKHFPRYWPFVWEFTGNGWIFLTKASDAELRCFIFILSAPWINGWVNNHKAGDLRCHRAHYDIIVMTSHDLSRPKAL